MKNSFYILILFYCSVFSQNPKKESVVLHVPGNCEMCEKTIEESLLVSGVKIADWNPDTQTLKVTYLPSKIQLSEIKALVSKVGYDVEGVKGDSLAYQNLPDCCKYRKK